MADNVNHPTHYTSHPSGVECIEITEHYSFCVGNAIKYLWRAGLKKDGTLADIDKEIEDVQKAAWYVQRHLENLKKKKHKYFEQLNKEIDDLPKLPDEAEQESMLKGSVIMKDESYLANNGFTRIICPKGKPV